MQNSSADEVIVNIEKCVHGGDGLARHDGKTYFIKDGIPGDTVSLRSITKKKRSFFAEIERVIKPSADRREPPCLHYSECGGCDWQHMTHNAQLKYKVAIFKDTLRFLGGVEESVQVESISGKEWNYRHRAQLKVQENSIGFYARKSHEVVAIESCPVLTEEINSSLQAFKEQDLSDIQQIKVFSNHKGVIASEPQFNNISTHEVCTEINGKQLMVSGSGFFQQNRELTPLLGSWVAKAVKTDYVIDLYGGSGFFSWMVHDQVKEIMLVEKEPELIRLAEETKRINNISNVKTLKMTAEKFFISQHFKNIKKHATLIVDPPRGGLHKNILPRLTKLRCARIIYVSCDPATQARDIKILIASGKFTLSQTALFDLYPNTHHMESVIILDYCPES
jgi:23S rRNA (uracil1939-C5)-methyltransferase